MTISCSILCNWVCFHTCFRSCYDLGLQQVWPWQQLGAFFYSLGWLYFACFCHHSNDTCIRRCTLFLVATHPHPLTLTQYLQIPINPNTINIPITYRCCFSVVTSNWLFEGYFSSISTGLKRSYFIKYHVLIKWILLLIWALCTTDS